ncbi:MAG: putative Ig domain-containing protein [Bacillota bacterium]
MNKSTQNYNGTSNLFATNGGIKAERAKKRVLAIGVLVLVAVLVAVCVVVIMQTNSADYVPTSVSVDGLENVLNDSGSIELTVAESSATSYSSQVAFAVNVEPFLIGYSVQIADTSVAKVSEGVLYAVSAGKTTMDIIVKEEVVATYNIVIYDELGNLTYTVNYINISDNDTVIATYEVTSGKSMAEMDFVAPDMPSLTGYYASKWIIEGATTTFFLDTVVDKDYVITVAYTAIPVSIVGGSLSTSTITYKNAMDEFSIAYTASAGSNSGYTFSSSNMPDGLILQSDGIIYGVPYTSGTVSFDVTVTDKNGTTATTEFSITIAKRSLDIYVYNTTVEYDGTIQTVKVEVQNIAENDDVSATIAFSTDPIEVGSYIGTLSGLTGEDSIHYTYNSYVDKYGTLTII